MKTVISIAYFLLCMGCFGQVNQQKLLVAEYRVDSPRVANYTYLVSYHFKDGRYLTKDTLFSAESSCVGRIKYIYKNRYVISEMGAVIDTETGRLLREQGDTFIEALGDTLIFHRRNVYTGIGYLSLNLITSRYGFINENGWYQPKMSRTSPDGNYFLTIDKSKIPYKVWLNGKNGQKTVLVQNAGHGPYTIDTQFPTVETHWLNPQSFLYVVHEPKKDSSGRYFYKVVLRRYNIEDHSDKVFFVLDSVPKGPFNGKFFVDGIGQTVYRTTFGNSYIIDTANQNLLENHYSQLGYRFSTRRFKEGTMIRYGNEEIGRIWCLEPSVTDGAMAVLYGAVGSNLGYPKGIKIWTRQTKDWLTIDIPWVSHIVGWMKDE